MDLIKNKSRIGFDATQSVFVVTNSIFRLLKFPIPMFSRQTIQSGGLQHQSWECLGAVQNFNCHKCFQRVFHNTWDFKARCLIFHAFFVYLIFI